MLKNYMVYVKLLGSLIALAFLLEEYSFPLALLCLFGLFVGYHLLLICWGYFSDFVWNSPQKTAMLLGNFIHQQFRRLAYLLHLILIQICFKLPQKLVRCFGRWFWQFFVWFKWTVIHRRRSKSPINW